jgi:diguanylate cyclase (GGDEF)-like protein
MTQTERETKEAREAANGTAGRMLPPVAAREARARLAIGRLGGVLFFAGAAIALPSLMTLDPAPPDWVFTMVVLAVTAGLACLWTEWDLLPGAWLHAIPVTGTLLVTAVIAGTHAGGGLYAWLYILMAVFVAYCFHNRVVVAAYLLLISAGCAAPLVDPLVSSSDTLRTLLVCVPSLVLATTVVTYLRERLEAGRDAYEELARRDPLTGVGNYRTLHERLDYEIARHERHGRSFAVMLLDMNRFKDVNEQHGHLEGDRVLREVGRALAATVRDQDTVARQGGDEFSVLAPETSTVEVMALASRLQRALSLIRVGDRTLGASMGWAIYPADGETAQQLLACADYALMAGKSRWLPQQSRDFWPEHVRRLSEGPTTLMPGAGEASAAS